MTPIRLFIADDHPVYREGLKSHWTSSEVITVVGSTGDGSQAVDAILAATPDVAIVDLRLPGASGLEILEQLSELHCEARVLVLTAYVDSASVYRALALGAGGFIEKAASFDEITAAVESIVAGETVIAPVVSKALAAEIRNRALEPQKSPLTDRETAILRLAADGLSGPQIARELGISVPTVKTHLAHVYTKLDVPDRASAVAQAFRRGLLE
ncbi:response regulator [Nocardioides sp. T5]|uniref:response regulator n=1 Tax=Nocardioides sp. T5 TaxID=3400182 RepID=UPI003A836B16